jgi:CDP-paratose 2-epimerase
LHVQDLCLLVEDQVRRLDEWDGWLGNVSGGFDRSVSLLELTALCREVTGSETPVGAGAAARPFDLRVYMGDCSRLFERTLWRPGRDVRTVVEDTARWARDHQEVLLKLW